MPRRFAPRPVGLEELASLLQETGTLLAAAPARLAGLYLLVFFPIQLLAALPYAAAPLRFSVSALALTGYYVVLEALRAGRPATLPDMLAPWRLPVDKVILLVASGLLPLIAVLLVWWCDLGWETVDAFLGGQMPADGFPMRQEVEFVVVLNGVALPLLFVQPLCALYPWSATRSLAASLIACAANWRWALALALLWVPIAIGLDSFDPQGAAEILLSLMMEVALEMALGAFTLVLLQRSLR